MKLAPLEGSQSARQHFRYRSRGAENEEDLDFYSTQQSAAAAMTTRNKGTQQLDE